VHSIPENSLAGRLETDCQSPLPGAQGVAKAKVRRAKGVAEKIKPEERGGCVHKVLNAL